jgi:hypothetical protein
MASSLNNSAWVEWMTTLMGGVSRQTYAATLPPDRFYCLLDELPLHLIPRYGGECLGAQQHQPLFLNPKCVVCAGGELPDGILARKEVLSSFALDGTIAWVHDAIRETWLPFWLGPKLEEVIRSLRAGEPAPSSISAEVRAKLRAAAILQSDGEVREQRQRQEENMAKAAAVFQEKWYAPVADLIHPFHIAALRRYYRYLIRTGAVRLGDRQSARRYIAYNEPVARFFHQQIAESLTAIAGEPVKPSYVYMASYLSGAELKKHTDRAQCEFSITLCLDFSPEPKCETPWPIELDTPTGSVKVYQALGDGLAYRGTRLPHYRGVLAKGQTSTSIFFHYVAEDFAGSLD